MTDTEYTATENRAAMLRFVNYARMPLEDLQGATTEVVLDQIRHARRELDYAEAFAVEALRGEGWSWSQVGELYGITKQAAQQRWGTPPRP